MSPNAPLTDAQRSAVTQTRARFSNESVFAPRGTSVEERAQHPDPGDLPADMTVRIEIAPPSPEPHPLLADTGVLKAPERVPLYFYALRSNGAEAHVDADPVDTRVLFFIHGGGNVSGHPTEAAFLQFYVRLLRGIAASAAGTTKWVLVAPSYRLARGPESVFPAGLQDLVAAYDHVLGKGYDPSNVFIAGDSAGGNHALVLTHLVLHAQRPPPRGVLAIAPAALQFFEDRTPRADIFDITKYERMAHAYLGESGISPAHPLASGALLPFSPAWPKTLVFAGTNDHLVDAARQVVRRLEAVGGQVELVEYDERPHGWWFIPDLFPENVLDAVERIVRFILIHPVERVSDGQRLALTDAGRGRDDPASMLGRTAPSPSRL